jgi:hypothetical protein
MGWDVGHDTGSIMLISVKYFPLPSTPVTVQGVLRFAVGLGHPRLDSQNSIDLDEKNISDVNTAYAYGTSLEYQFRARYQSILARANREDITRAVTPDYEA